MLETDFETDQEGMTVPYPPLYDDIRRNHGFVDIRGRPDLASKIPEASQSPAFASLWRGSNQMRNGDGCHRGGVPTTKFDHRMLSNDPTADHVTGGVTNSEPPIQFIPMDKSAPG